MFIQCGIPKIDLFCLLPSTKNFSIMFSEDESSDMIKIRDEGLAHVHVRVYIAVTVTDSSLMYFPVHGPIPAVCLINQLWRII